MRALHLDFRRPVPPQSAAGYALLVAGMLALGTVAYLWRDTAAEVDRLEAQAEDFKRLARREMPRIPADAGDAKQLAAEIRAANQVIAQMSLPWDALFRELEAAAVQDVALLAIQPDVNGRQIRLAGEARRYPDVLAYVASLEKRAGLANVFLLSHELKQAPGERPVAFTLIAEWVPVDVPEPPAPPRDADVSAAAPAEP